MERCPECGSDGEHADWCLWNFANPPAQAEGFTVGYWDGDDTGEAGVREPRRPRPSQPGSSAEA
jgi:hypothetical protein